ncbi:MAG TPA: tripartite tricarboxylate transporter substrate binding protein [Pseudolabrys sp.]|nr:tripartite tricarboxylate transporter substrate binding protein [Pseudolabrys sp.]
MLRTFALLLAALLGWSSAQAADWPTRPVHLIVPFSAGGGTDLVARVLGQKLAERFGQQFVVENRTGASGMIGAGIVAHAQPDGYTLLVASPAEIALNPNLFKSMTYDPVKDLTPITLLAWTPMVLAAHPSFPASTPAELIKMAQAGQVDFSSPGIGSAHQLVGEYINLKAHTKLTHIPYKGAAPAVTDAVAGQVKLTVSGMPPVVGFLKSGALKAIALTSKSRLPMLPNIPTMAEVKGFEDCDFTNWFGLLAPAGTPAPILDQLHQAAVDALKDAHVRSILDNQAAVPVGDTPAEFAAFIKAENAKYGKIVKAAHLETH